MTHLSTTYDLDRAHVFHSWSAQAEISPMVIAGASGSEVWDEDGTRFLDFSSQLVFTNIGHQHPKVVAAIQEQAAKLCTVGPPFANEARSEAARLIAERTPDGLERVFFTNGGAGQRRVLDDRDLVGELREHAVRCAGRRRRRRRRRSRNVSMARRSAGDSALTVASRSTNIR